MLLVLALTGALVWTVWFSTLLTLRTVTVEGVGGAERTAVIEAAKAPLGVPLVSVDTDAITERVRGRITVAEARVTRSWPHAITITVQPRVAALVLKNPQGQLEVVDATGVIFGQVPAAPPGVPVVSAASDAGADKSALMAALSLIKALPKDLADQVTTITVSSANLVTFTLGDVPVTWGGADQPARKIQILRALLKTHPSAIDISAPDTPVTR
jgi:cell division protein FtsQ